MAGESLFRNGIYIMGMTAVPSLAGFGFWIIAARTLPAAEVGRAAALVSALLLTSIVTNLGMGQVFISRLHSRASGHDWSLTVTTGLLLAGVTSLIGGAVVAVALPQLVSDLTVGVGFAAFALLPLGVAGASWSLALDHVSIAERDTKAAFVRNAGAAVFRLALIGFAGVVPVDGATWIMLIWTATFLLSDLWAVTSVLPRLGRGFRLVLSGAREELRAMRELIVGHQAINLGSQFSVYVLPLLVFARLGPTENAYFYTTFMLSNGLTFIAPSITDALFAEGAHSPATINRDVRRAIGHILKLAGPPALVLIVAGPLILGVFGPQYADEGTTLLRILVIGGAFGAALLLAMAVLRARGQLSDGARATFTGLIVSVLATWFLLPSLGLPGAGIGLTIGQASGMALAIYFVRRGPRSGRVRRPREPLLDGGAGPDSGDPA